MTFRQCFAAERTKIYVSNLWFRWSSRRQRQVWHWWSFHWNWGLSSPRSASPSKRWTWLWQQSRHIQPWYNALWSKYTAMLAEIFFPCLYLMCCCFYSLSRTSSLMMRRRKSRNVWNTSTVNLPSFSGQTRSKNVLLNCGRIFAPLSFNIDPKTVLTLVTSRSSLIWLLQHCTPASEESIDWTRIKSNIIRCACIYLFCLVSGSIPGAEEEVGGCSSASGSGLFQLPTYLSTRCLLSLWPRGKDGLQK